MNSVTGEITSIKVSGNISLVTIMAHTIFFKTLVVETPATATWLKLYNKINMIFKETEVVIGKGLEHPVSLQNKLPGKIIGIENGELMSQVKVDTVVGNIVAIISRDAVVQLNLQVGETVSAMVKTNEIMISQ
ncbi:MAG: TOBE domain-containing protein [Ginsengibacter sp.]